MLYSISKDAGGILFGFVCLFVFWCVRNGRESDCRDLVNAFSDWSQKNYLILNTSKKKW